MPAQNRNRAMKMMRKASRTYLELQNNRPFLNSKSSFSGEILHHFCIFNGKLGESCHIYCNSLLVSQRPIERVMSPRTLTRVRS